MAPCFIPGNDSFFFFACNDALVRSVSCVSLISWACVLKSWWISVTLGSRNEGDKNPIWFTLGMGEVLKGWDKGLKDMCTGERRKLTVPPSLAYGKEGKGNMRCLDVTNLLLLLCSTTFWLWPFFFRQNPSKQHTDFWRWAHGHQKWAQVTWFLQRNGSEWWLETIQGRGLESWGSIF